MGLAPVEFNLPRTKQVVLTRIKLGRCRLNHYLHIANCHPTGLCDFCGIKEDIQHFLVDCATGNVATAVRGLISSSPQLPQRITDYRDVINIKEVREVIFKNIDRTM